MRKFVSIALSTCLAAATLVSAGSRPARAEDAKNAKNDSGTKIAVMRFNGPVIVDLDADEIWKMKSKLEVPGKGTMTGLSDDLQKTLTSTLEKRLGATVVPLPDLKQAMETSKVEVGKSFSPDLASKVGARYFVTGTIDRAEFDGNTVMKDAYAVTLTTQIVDARTGQSVWSETLKKFMTKAFTRKTGKTVYDTFKDVQIPEVASYLSEKIASAVGR